MARKILENEPVAVTAKFYFDKKGGVDLKGVALLEFPNEVTAMIAFSLDAVYQNNYSLWGSQGLIRAEMAYSIPPDMKPIVELMTKENLKETVTRVAVPAANHFELIFQDFCDTVLNKDRETDKITNIYTSILNQAKAMEAIRIASQENRKVNLSEIN